MYLCITKMLHISVFARFKDLKITVCVCFYDITCRNFIVILCSWTGTSVPQKSKESASLYIYWLCGAAFTCVLVRAPHVSSMPPVLFLPLFFSTKSHGLTRCCTL